MSLRLPVAWALVVASVLCGACGCSQPANAPPTPEEAAKTPPLTTPPIGSEGTRAATDG